MSTCLFVSIESGTCRTLRSSSTLSPVTSHPVTDAEKQQDDTMPTMNIRTQCPVEFKCHLVAENKHLKGSYPAKKRGMHRSFTSAWTPSKAFEVLRPYLMSCSRLELGPEYSSFGQDLRAMVNHIDEDFKSFTIDIKLKSTGNVEADFHLIQQNSPMYLARAREFFAKLMLFSLRFAAALDAKRSLFQAESKRNQILRTWVSEGKGHTLGKFAAQLVSALWTLHACVPLVCLDKLNYVVYDASNFRNTDAPISGVACHSGRHVYAEMDNTATARGHHMAGTCHDTLALVDRLSLVTISSSHYWDCWTTLWRKVNLWYAPARLLFLSNMFYLCPAHDAAFQLSNGHQPGDFSQFLYSQ